MCISIKTFIFVAQKEVVFLKKNCMLIFARYISLSFVLSLLPIFVAAQNFTNQTDVQWSAVPSHADWLYKTGEKAQIELQLLLHGQPAAGVEVSYNVGGDCLPSEQEAKVTTDSHGRAIIPVGTSKRPGFRDTRMQCVIDGVTYNIEKVKIYDNKTHLYYTTDDTQRIDPWNDVTFAIISPYWDQLVTYNSDRYTEEGGVKKINGTNGTF